MNNEKFEKLDNEQKELVKYWVDRFYNECSPLSRHEWIDKYLTPEFNPKVGTWYITTDDDGNEFLFNHQEDGKSYGFFKGVWTDTYWDTTSNWTNPVTEATPEEVKQRLIKEANRRGYKNAVTCLFGSLKQKRILEDGIWKLIENMTVLTFGRDGVFYNYQLV